MPSYNARIFKISGLRAAAKARPLILPAFNIAKVLLAMLRHYLQRL